MIFKIHTNTTQNRVNMKLEVFYVVSSIKAFFLSALTREYFLSHSTGSKKSAVCVASNHKEKLSVLSGLNREANSFQLKVFC